MMGANIPAQSKSEAPVLFAFSHCSPNAFWYFGSCILGMLFWAPLTNLEIASETCLADSSKSCSDAKEKNKMRVQSLMKK